MSGENATGLVRPRKAILIPGNGCGDDLSECMWYPWLQEKLQREYGISMDLRGFPDHLEAHESIWKSFVVDELGLDSETIVIGHSSGAACALRLMEEHSFAMCALVAAYNTDLDDDLERESGYFSRPFSYEVMRRNVPFILQFHSASDHLVPVRIGRAVARELKSDYVETDNDGHFQADEYDDVIWPKIQEAMKKF